MNLDLGYEWVERQLPHYDDPTIPKALNDAQRRCLNVLSAIPFPSGLYNLYTPLGGGNLKAFDFFGAGAMSVLFQSDLATYDASELTRLVLAAHQYHVRVSISPWCSHQDEVRARRVATYMTECRRDYTDDPDEVDWESGEVGAGIMQIMLHPRQPPTEGDRGWDRHPGLAELIAMSERDLP